MDGFNKTKHHTDKKKACTTTLKMKKKLSICESLLCLDLVIFLVLNGIKPQAPLQVVPFRQSLHVSGLRPYSPQKHKTLISQLDPSWFGLRLFPCVKGSYLRLDIKGRESIPDGMGCHLPMKLRGQNSRSQRKTRIQFSCIPQVAPRHRGNDCQIRWNVSEGSLFISTVASVSSSSDSKTLLLLLPWLPLLQWLPKILKKTFVNKQLEPKTQSFLAACCGLSQVTGRG